jgi:hypothetical protein
MTLGPHFDPMGDSEPENTIYTISVLCPPRSTPKWLADILNRVTNSSEPPYTNTNSIDTEKWPMQSMKIKRALFPVEMRCDHLRDKTT